MPGTFNAGDQVLFNPAPGPDELGFFRLTAVSDRRAGEVWEVVCVLSPIEGVHQYRIEARQDGRKRIATTSQLRPAL
jgi:hypothetical protein